MAWLGLLLSIIKDVGFYLEFQRWHIELDEKSKKVERSRGIT